MKKFLVWVFQSVMTALGVKDKTKEWLLIFILISLIEAPAAIPYYFKMSYGIYYTWKNNLPPSTLTGGSRSSRASAPTTIEVPMADVASHATHRGH